MPVFPRPRFDFAYDVSSEIERLRQHKGTRMIPQRTDGTILVATWNIANLGAQKRRDQDRSLIAEIISWFDVVAIQECRAVHDSHPCPVIAEVPHIRGVLVPTVCAGTHPPPGLFFPKPPQIASALRPYPLPQADSDTKLTE